MLLVISSCSKLVEVDGPSTNINKDNVYKSDVTAEAVLNGIYSTMSSSRLIDGNSINSFMNLYPELSGDELTLFGSVQGDLQSYYINTLNSGTGTNVWSVTYPFIFTVNSAIEGLNSSNSLTPAVKKQLLGEARFLRAFYYFYLVNLYGDVPLITGTDYKLNTVMARTDKKVVYDQILVDLNAADTLLSEKYLDINVQKVTSERIAPVKWAADAMLARVYLYSKEYANAESASSQVIENSALYTITSLEDVFKSNNSEAIWQLQPVNSGWNTEEARLYILPETGPSDSWPVYLSNNLLSAFEENDQRRVNWVDSVIVDGIIYYYPAKYKSANTNDPVTEYQVVLRLAEQYLIRAEARAQQNNLDGAVEDLNIIRARAGLDNYNSDMNKEAIIKSIIHERQVEYFTEWGHRWLDLKRTGLIDEVMSVVTPEKGGIWKSTAQYYPISDYELRYNPNLIQNQGY